MYGMPEARVVALFQGVLGPGFGGDTGSVEGSLPKPVRWDGSDGTGGLQKQLTDHTASVTRQVEACIQRMEHPEGRELATLCLQLSISFLHSFCAFITRWYRQLEGAKVYQPAACWTLVVN